jgi:transposase
LLTGIKLRANPTPSQNLILSQWMGCAKFIWNAKCGEEKYYSTFARKYYPLGTYAPVDQKAGLNKAILANGWYMLESYVKYKAKREAMAVFKVNAAYTSQECAKCDHTHPDNRQSQDKFVCGNCGNVDNADSNASKVIAKRAINLLLDSGTELSKRGVLRLGNGRGSKRKTCKRSEQASTNETSKKINQVASAA